MKTKLKGHAGKSKSREEWVYGLNPVIEALKSGRQMKALLISTSRRDVPDSLVRAAASRGIAPQRREPAFFDRMFPKGHQGFAASVEAREYHEAEDVLSIPERSGEPGLFLVLDCLEDPRNFGAILRIADASGVHGIFIQAYRSVSLSSEAVKASAGAAEYVPVAVVPNIKNIMREMKEQGIVIIGAEAEEGSPVWEVDLTVPVAIVIGSEGKGMRRTVREECDRVVSIPMRGKVNSLNASAAAGILVFEAIRQRMRAG